jgi:hypothetical protein
LWQDVAAALKIIRIAVGCVSIRESRAAAMELYMTVIIDVVEMVCAATTRVAVRIR